MRLIRLLKRELAGEISAWVEQKIISVQQAEAIGRLYGVEYGKKQNRAYAILTVLGYLFVGLAAIVLIGHNWEDLSRELRMGGLLILTLGTQGIALKHYFSGRVGGATGLFFLGNLFYGASIILIAQIYHLGEHYPDGVFWWAVGSLPFGVLLLSPWLTLFSLLLALLWFAMEWELGFFPVSFPLFLVAATYVLFKGRQSVMLFLVSAFAMLLWLEYFCFPDAGLTCTPNILLLPRSFLFSPTPSVLGCIKPTARRPKIIVCYWRCGLCVLPLLQCWRLVLKHRGKN